MSFHQNFWLATSAAAPVITLAIVVGIPDAAGIRFRAERRKWELRDPVASTASATPKEVPAAPVSDEQRLEEVKWAVKVTRRNVHLCYANLIFQAALLAGSLAALAYSRDLVPPWVAIVFAVGGVGLLAWTLLRGTGIRDRVEQAIADDHGTEGRATVALPPAPSQPPVQPAASSTLTPPPGPAVRDDDHRNS